MHTNRLRGVPAAREVGAARVTAPASTGTVPPTSKRRGPNRLQWLQIQLFLEDLPKRPGGSS